MTERTAGLHGLGPVASFTALYLSAATVLAFARGNYEFLYYIVVMLLLVCVVWLVRRAASLTTAAIWGLSVWGLLHMCGGLLVVPASWPIDSGSRVLYSLWLVPGVLKYDQLVHAYGFGVATWVCWQGMSAALAKRGEPIEPTLGLMVLAATAGMGLGALNEVVEFLATLAFPSTNVGGYLNTGWDLVANFVGAAVAVTVIYRLGTRHA
jgi:hypothetical protein